MIFTNNQPQFTATISAISHDGRGISHINGKTIFLDGGLSNEEVSFIYLKHHNNYDEGVVVAILNNLSPDRAAPQCPHFSICGGCSLQHLNHEKQLALKTKVLLEQFKHFGNLIPKTLAPPITGPIWGYRHKARLSLKYVTKKNKLLIGFHEKHGRFVADIQECQILNPIIGNKILALNTVISNLSIYNQIPQIEIAINNNTAALVLRHLQPLTPEDQVKLQNFGQANNFRIYLQPHGLDSVHPLASNEPLELLSYKLQTQNLELFFHPTDFTQINPYINQQMVNTVIELLNPLPDESVLDLFCGLGNFTLPIAQRCASIIGIEGNNCMVERAKKNAAHNNIKNADFYCADLTKEFTNNTIEAAAKSEINLAHLTADGSWKSKKFSKILLDPPRTGALEIVKKLALFEAKKIVYVSCNPATLARDAKELIQQNYELIYAGIIDMFPHTSHVETIAVFSLIK